MVHDEYVTGGPDDVKRIKLSTDLATGQPLFSLWRTGATAA